MLVGMQGSLFLRYPPTWQPRSNWNYWSRTPCSPAAAHSANGSSIAAILLQSFGVIFALIPYDLSPIEAQPSRQTFDQSLG